MKATYHLTDNARLHAIIMRDKRNEDDITMICPICQSDNINVDTRSVLDIIQDDEYGRDLYADDYRISCNKCGFLFCDWSDEE